MSTFLYRLNYMGTHSAAYVCIRCVKKVACWSEMHVPFSIILLDSSLCMVKKGEKLLLMKKMLLRWAGLFTGSAGFLIGAENFSEKNAFIGVVAVVVVK